jgi:hypothetical protein
MASLGQKLRLATPQKWGAISREVLAFDFIDTGEAALELRGKGLGELGFPVSKNRRVRA